MEDDQDDDFIDWMLNGVQGTNPDEYQYERAQKIVQGDKRINKPRRYSDIEAEAKDVLAYQQSDLYKNTERAKYLINDLPGEINSEDLKSTMKYYYNVSDKEYDSILHNLSNQKDLSVSRSVFDRKIKISSKR